ncbi:MAG TPA: glycosyltransferase family 2 protein [Gemmatimonadaceae bacterium]|nr:glycosyltransferase family 2 protein [Gemmatimonadaceae bacterium]
MSQTSGGSPGVTAVIAAHDESANIEACIASVEWTTEVIVVENDSTDDTVDRARAAGATVISPPFTTIGAARNHAIARAKTPWIFVVDADERCSPELAAEIQQITRNTDRQAFRVPRRNFFLGREIRHGGWGSDRPIRLFRRDLRYSADLVHEHVDVPAGAQTGDLTAALTHYTYTSLDQYFEKLDRYSKWWAQQNYAKGRRVGASVVLFRPPARFFRMYALKGGFRDGARGIVLASLAAASVMAKYARLWELSVRGESGSYEHTD